jgi:predicted nuclease of predicted toxin-antitoxin system
VRFYLDENLSSTIAEIGRGLGLDVVSSEELGRNGLSDEEQLRLAAEDGCCLVTADLGFINLSAVFAESLRPHAGVLIVPPTWSTSQFARIARALAAYVQRFPGDTTDYLVDYLR